MRNENIAMLDDTLDILEQGHYKIGDRTIKLKLSRDEMEAAEVFLPKEVEAFSGCKDFNHFQSEVRCEYSCVNSDSFTQARKRQMELTQYFDGDGNENEEKPVLVLNLANPLYPGGGVRNGAKAQEEDLCRKSSLLVSLESRNASRYYAYNRSLYTYMGSDAVIIHPQVEIIKDENGTLLEDTVIVAVMTCAAPMIKYGLEGMTQQQYESMVYKRITGMLKVAAYMGYRYLVLGAFGCGAFRNDARIVSDLFYRALKEFDYDGMKERDMFRKIDFAVMDHSYDQYNYKEFSRNFSNFYRGEDQEEYEMRLSLRQREPVFFWKVDEENGWLSNWYQSKFVIDDFEYLHVEQYMMSRKAKLFHDSAAYTAILRATDPHECKKLGKGVKPFDPSLWDIKKYEIVKKGNRAKYEQNPALKQKLLDTGNAVLAEASPRDRIWGIALDAAAAARKDPSVWPGQNLLGRILMELRDEFRSADAGTSE